jgi:hypothetical protein
MRVTVSQFYQARELRAGYSCTPPHYSHPALLVGDAAILLIGKSDASDGEADRGGAQDIVLEAVPNADLAGVGLGVIGAE